MFIVFLKMINKRNSLYLFFSGTLIALLASCSLLSYHAKFVEPNPRADTYDKEIKYQNKQVFSSKNGSIQIDNQFDAARMNECRQVNDSIFAIAIYPENYPINESPWYAFRIVSKVRKEIWLQLDYEKSKHRYIPKTSNNRKIWIPINKELILASRGDSTVLFPIRITSDTTWVAGQEIINSSDVEHWLENLSNPEYIRLSEYGKSRLGRSLQYLDIYHGKKKRKPIIIITGRQHPPELTGYLAMQSFVETLLDNSEQSKKFLQKYRVLIYPMVNPDGIDLGHWRHNAGGVDLNRDWGNYHQPEIRQLCDHIVTQGKKNRADILLGIDFHSTQKDIFYTNEVDPATMKIGNFTKNWLGRLDIELQGYDLIVEPSNVRPVATSKNWFYVELGAAGITYEIGDNTPREFIHKKGQVSANAMMELLTAQTFSLFNGKNLDGWHIDVPEMDNNSDARNPFIVRDGMLVSLGTPGGHLITDKIYGDYRLEIEYRFANKPGNCGVLVHASTPRALYDMFPKSLEVQMQHQDAGDFWCIVEDVTVPDMLKRRGPEENWGIVEGKNRRIKNLTDGSEKPLGEWNNMTIECRADTIEVWINGDRVNFGYNCTASKGQIALQAEGSEVEFRKLLLTMLK